MQRLVLSAAVLGASALMALPALAGGRLVGTCPPGYAVTYDARGGATCAVIRSVNPNGPAVVVSEPTTTRRLSVLCPYPHRPSDTVFRGGSGYLIKDDVRRANGCL